MTPLALALAIAWNLFELSCKGILYYSTFEAEVGCAMNIAYRESRWNPNAVNPKSGASGLFQLMPRTRTNLTSRHGTRDFRSVHGQTRAATLYMAPRYGSWARGWRHWQRRKWW